MCLLSHPWQFLASQVRTFDCRFCDCFVPHRLLGPWVRKQNILQNTNEHKAYDHNTHIHNTRTHKRARAYTNTHTRTHSYTHLIMIYITSELSARQMHLARFLRSLLRSDNIVTRTCNTLRNRSIYLNHRKV